MPRDYTSRHSIALLKLRFALTFDKMVYFDDDDDDDDDDDVGSFLCRIKTSCSITIASFIFFARL